MTRSSWVVGLLAALAIAGCGGRPDSHDEASSSWWRFSFTTRYLEKADASVWQRRNTPPLSTTTAFLSVAADGHILEFRSVTRDPSGRIWADVMQHAAEARVTERQWLSCAIREGERADPATLQQALEDVTGAMTVPAGARHAGGASDWTEPQGVLTRHVHQRDDDWLSRVVTYTRNGDTDGAAGKALFVQTDFDFRRVPGPGSADLGVEFSRQCPHPGPLP